MFLSRLLCGSSVIFSVIPVPMSSCPYKFPVPMYYDRIGYEMTLLEGVPLDELFHMMLCFSSAFYFQVDPHVADCLTRGISQEEFSYERDFLILPSSQINSYGDLAINVLS